MADMPFMPVRSTMAMSSALDSLSAPCVANRSRGRSCAGRSWMRTLAVMRQDWKSQISNLKASREEKWNEQCPNERVSAPKSALAKALLAVDRKPVRLLDDVRSELAAEMRGNAC